MALENYRPIQFPEKTEIDNTDVVLIDSSTNGTNKYQLSRITAEAEAKVNVAVAAEATARDAAIAAETAARKQDVADLKADLSAIYDGEIEYTKANAIHAFEQISTNYLYQNVGLTIGVSKFNNVTRGASAGTYALKIPLDNVQKIKYPVFKTTSHYASFIFDDTDTIIWAHEETVENTGYEKTITVPENASWMLLSISASLSQIDWTVVLTRLSLDGLENDMVTMQTDIATNENNIEYLYGKTITKTEAIQAGAYSTNYLYFAGKTFVGNSFSQLVPAASTGAIAFIVDVSKAKTISYPVFKSSSNLGTLIFNDDDICVWAHSETRLQTGAMKTISVPDDASYMLLSITSSLNATDWKCILYAIPQTENVTPFIDVNRNMCLAGIKTDILTNKIPYHRGFLFHLLQNNDNSLWYGTDFDHINKIGSVSYNPTLMRFAISPKDGRIIAVQRDERNGIWVWDGTTETHLNSFASNPQAWLYNSGVDFINDGSDEYCVFAEYSSSIVQGYALNVWRGKYPYTSTSDWEIVFSQNQGTDITHFHMIRRDPWTNILYLTAGDSSEESKWWYSTDKGATWTLLVSGADTGWGNSLCRTINFIFTKDYIYWATDHGVAGVQHHTLNRIQRDSNTGVMDLTTKEQMTLLPQLYATNSLCYVESPNGLFMYDRIDTASSSVFGEPIKMLFWDFATEQLIEIASLKLTTATWGGSRGKCYINYTNSKEVMPAMGFSIDTPCIFDLVCDNPSNIGTIAYDVGSKTIHTVDY